MTETKTELKPCPFCGGPAVVYPKRPEIEGGGFGQVRCETEGCDAQPCVNSYNVEGAICSDDYKADAIRRWSTRAPDPVATQREAELSALDSQFKETAKLLAKTGTDRDALAKALERADAALFVPGESDAAANLEGALCDIKCFSEAGNPADAVCIKTIERVIKQIEIARTALRNHKGPRP